MTPQMLITIPQAATFGPQNRSDGMSVSGDRSIRNWFDSDSFKPRNVVIEAASRSADLRHSVPLGGARPLSWLTERRPIECLRPQAPPLPLRRTNGSCRCFLFFFFVFRIFDIFSEHEIYSRFKTTLTLNLRFSAEASFENLVHFSMEARYWAS